MNIKEIKLEINRLRRLKLKCRSGSKERIELHRQIKGLQSQLEQGNEINKDKEPLIQEILKLDNLMSKLNIDLTKHSMESLQKYLNKLKQRRSR